MNNVPEDFTPVMAQRVCSVLHCDPVDISGVTPIAEGLTNVSYVVEVAGQRYVYRHPGVATKGLLNRAAEAEAEAIAFALGLDGTFIYIDPVEGWKLSHFVTVTEPFDYHSDAHVGIALAMARNLHESGRVIEQDFDLGAQTAKIRERLDWAQALARYPDLEELDDRANRLSVAVAPSCRPVLSHNDFYAPNILVTGDTCQLIDWEYAGMNDYASDLGTFIACSDYSVDQAKNVLDIYFGRSATAAEQAHCLSFVGLSAYYWFVWAINMEANGESVGDWLELWRQYSHDYGIVAEKLLKAEPAAASRQTAPADYSLQEEFHG